MPSEINVIGRTVDDATREVEKFVDRAFLAGLPRVRVVHGSGMGILRKALRQYLQKHPHVEYECTERLPREMKGGVGGWLIESMNPQWLDLSRSGTLDEECEDRGASTAEGRSQATALPPLSMTKGK